MAGLALTIQIEEPGVGPGVGTVHRHVDRGIADDADTPLPGVTVQAFPLAEEEILVERLLVHGPGQFRAEGRGHRLEI